MRIWRGPLPADRFTQISNDWLRDRRLGWKARGVLGWLASHGPGFVISQAAIIAASDEDGRDAVRAALRQLEKYGYLVRVQSRDARGRHGEIVYKLMDPWS
ncbi:helix-turn-helix domain-containing protein, partial [Sphaerimonospora thailandensis]